MVEHLVPKLTERAVQVSVAGFLRHHDPMTPQPRTHRNKVLAVMAIVGRGHD